VRGPKLLTPVQGHELRRRLIKADAWKRLGDPIVLSSRCLVPKMPRKLKKKLKKQAEQSRFSIGFDVTESIRDRLRGFFRSWSETAQHTIDAAQTHVTTDDVVRCLTGILKELAPPAQKESTKVVAVEQDPKDPTRYLFSYSLPTALPVLSTDITIVKPADMSDADWKLYGEDLERIVADLNNEAEEAADAVDVAN